MSKRDDFIMDLRLLHLESKIARLKVAMEAIMEQPCAAGRISSLIGKINEVQVRQAAGRISRQALEPHHPLEG